MERSIFQIWCPWAYKYYQAHNIQILRPELSTYFNTPRKDKFIKSASRKHLKLRLFEKKKTWWTWHLNSRAKLMIKTLWIYRQRKNIWEGYKKLLTHTRKGLYNIKPRNSTWNVTSFYRVTERYMVYLLNNWRKIAPRVMITTLQIWLRHTSC